MQMQSLQKVAYLNQPLDGQSYDAHTVQVLSRHLERQNNRLRTTKQHPLQTHYGRGEITAQQLVAGEKLQRDYAIAHRNTLILERLMGGGAGVMRITAEDQKTARDRYSRIMASLNNVSRYLAANIIIEGLGLADVRMEMGWSGRNTGLDRLKEVLDEIELLQMRMDRGENVLDIFLSEFDRHLKKTLEFADR